MCMKGHTGVVRSVNFSSDSQHLITSSDDKSVKVFIIVYYCYCCYCYNFIYHTVVVTIIIGTP